MKRLNSKQKLAFFLTVLTTSYLLLALARYWLADYFYANGPVELAVRLSPGEPVYRVELAKTYAALGNAKLTEEEITYAKRTSPRNIKLLKEIANIYSDLSDIDRKYLLKEHEELKEILSLAPTDVQVWYQLALSYGKLGQMEESRNTLQKVLEMKPDYEKAQEYLKVLSSRT